MIPKKHRKNFVDMQGMTGFLEFAQRVAEKIVTGVKAEGFNFGTNNGAAAGQAVLHTHFHIIPRWDGDGLQNWPGSQVTPEKLKEVQQNILQ